MPFDEKSCVVNWNFVQRPNLPPNWGQKCCPAFQKLQSNFPLIRDEACPQQSCSRTCSKVENHPYSTRANLTQRPAKRPSTVSTFGNRIQALNWVHEEVMCGAIWNTSVTSQAVEKLLLTLKFEVLGISLGCREAMANGPPIRQNMYVKLWTRYFAQSFYFSSQVILPDTIWTKPG